MKISKAISFLLTGVLLTNFVAPLARAQQPQGPKQTVHVVVAQPTDPGDAIIADGYADLPTSHPGLSTTNSDPDASYMWTTSTLNFLNAVDLSQPPVDPDTFNPPANPPPPLGRPIRINRGTLPWEGNGGAINNGGGLIHPGGGGTGHVGGRGEISGQTNTHTGMLGFEVPVVSFSGPGSAQVSLSLVLKPFTPFWAAKVWTDNYDVRLDLSNIQGIATVTMPDGLTLPFVKTGPGNGPNMLATYAGPMGVRAKLETSTLGWARLTWRNGDVWMFNTSFGGPNDGSRGSLQSIGYMKGGSISISRTFTSTTISTGSRSATITTGGSLPSGLQGRISAPNGNTDISTASSGGPGENYFQVSYPGNLKKITLYYQNVTQNFAGGQYQAGSKFSAYRDAKQTALNSGYRYIYTYDSYGRVLSIIDPNGNGVQYSYVSPGQTRITDEAGNVSWDYYSNGQYIGGVDEANFTTVVTRNAEHDVTAYRNERNQTWTIVRSSLGDATSVTNPLNQTTTYTYNALGDITSKTNAIGATTTFQYNGALGNLSSVVNPLGTTVASVNYDSLGQPTSVSDAMGRLSSMTYNSTGDLVSTTSPEGLTSSVTVDPLGLPLRATDPQGRVTVTQYDPLSRVTSITDPAGSVTQYSYDLNDNIVQVLDPLGRASTMTYDLVDNLATSTNPRGDAETYTYTALGQLHKVTNGRSKTRTYQYAARGELKFIYLPDGTTEYYTYQGDGNLASFFGSGRQTTNYLYDNAGNLSATNYPNMVGTTFTYDAAGRQIAMTDGTGQTSWFYDAANEPTTLNQAGKVTSYTYNLAGQRTGMTQPAGSTAYTYDSYGRMNGLVNPFNESTYFTYDSYSRPSMKTLSAGQYESYQYDGLDRLAGMSVKNSTTGSVMHSEGYTYNAASEILSHTEDGVTTNYGYDAASQLISETRPGYSCSYTFDGNGNRLTKNLGGSVENYAYDNGDKLLSAGSKTYTYDAAGRTVQVQSGGATTSLVYDDEDRLTSVTGSFGTQSYRYNGYDTRASKTANGSVTSYHRDGSGVTAPLLSDTGSTYTPGISEKRNGVTTYLHGGIKDASAQSDISQSITATRKYDAYGMVTSASGTWQGPFGYSGQAGYQEDETGLQLLGHRYYDPSTGRFLTRDPAMEGTNWYSYCESNPIDQTDETGLDPGDKFKNPKLAAKDATGYGRRKNKKQKTNKEHGGYIYQNDDGTYSYTYEEGDLVGVQLGRRPKKATGSWHTHPKMGFPYPGLPSGTITGDPMDTDKDDQDVFKSLPGSSFVGQPNGGLEQYYPTGGKGRLVIPGTSPKKKAAKKKKTGRKK